MVRLTIDNVEIGLRVQLTNKSQGGTLSIYKGTVFEINNQSGYKEFYVKWDGLGSSHSYDKNILREPGLTWKILSEQSSTTETFPCKNCNKQNDVGKHVCWSCASLLCNKLSLVTMAGINPDDYSSYNLVGLTVGQVQCLVDALIKYDTILAKEILSVIPTFKLFQ